MQAFGVCHDIWPRIRSPGWVRLGQKLARSLTEICDLRHHCFAGHTLFQPRDVHRTLICKVVENVASFLSGLAALLVPKHQVYPLVQVRRDILALKRSPVQPHKLCSVPLCPRRKYDGPDLLTILARTKVNVVDVSEKFWVVEKLGNELLDVTRVRTPRTALPALRDAVKLPVWQIQPPTLQRAMIAGVWLQPHQVVQYVRRRRVVTSVVEGRCTALVLVPVFESCSGDFLACGIKSTHGLAQVPKSRSLGEIQHVTGVVGQYPRHDRVLREVVDASPCQHVELQQVVQVAHTPQLPRPLNLLSPRRPQSSRAYIHVPCTSLLRSNLIQDPPTCCISEQQSYDACPGVGVLKNHKGRTPNL
mmetsp:Transcript_17670/g.44476  ORF Transcript_17670/g.44476 Transcript_17670/m.44476 type:complete len:361 (-) Transcript_17670:2286-3368(-)